MFTSPQPDLPLGFLLFAYNFVNSVRGTGTPHIPPNAQPTTQIRKAHSKCQSENPQRIPQGNAQGNPIVIFGTRPTTSPGGSRPGRGGHATGPRAMARPGHTPGTRGGGGPSPRPGPGPRAKGPRPRPQAQGPPQGRAQGRAQRRAQGPGQRPGPDPRAGPRPQGHRGNSRIPAGHIHAGHGNSRNIVVLFLYLRI